MILLPVVERELRVGSRSRSTYRVRFLAALIPTLFSIFSLWFVRVVLREPPISPRELFLFLAWIEFLFVIGAGFCLTCDSISHEKRDATLGLLFLTDLRGYDIVLGKLAVAVLRGLSALLGTVPVLALPLMLGGTDLTELSRTSLTLILTLFLSMTVGLLASAVMRRAWTAFGVSAFVLLTLCLALPLYSQFVRIYFREPFIAHLIELPSPSFAFLMSMRTAMGLSGYGYSLGIIATLAFLALVAAVVVTPHVWKDRPAARRLSVVLEWVRRAQYGAGEARDRFRRRLLERNPIFWLSRRERVSSLGLLLTILAIGAIASWFASRDWAAGPQPQVFVPFVSWTLGGAAIHLLILLRLAIVASERFGEDRRSGALELTLSTPITIKEVLAGHWMALRRYFAGPVLIAFGIQVLAIFLLLNIQSMEVPPRRTVWQMLVDVYHHVMFGTFPDREMVFHVALLIGLALFPMLALNWMALAWLSTSFSLRTKTALAAPIAALFVLHFPPVALFIAIITFLAENDLLPSSDLSAFLVGYLLAILMLGVHQILCILRSRKRLHAHFRTAATDRYQPHIELRPWWKWWPRPLHPQARHEMRVNTAPL